MVDKNGNTLRNTYDYKNRLFSMKNQMIAPGWFPSTVLNTWKTDRNQKNGKITKTYEYDSFGNEVKPEKKDDNPFRYCGEYYDKETGEVYLRARYYIPAVGRFLTRDTYTGESDDLESLHLYTYCGNDGVNAWDPSGHWKQKTHKRITKKVFKIVGKKLKSHAKKHIKKAKEKYKKAKKYILKGSVLPDIAREKFEEKRIRVEYSKIWNLDLIGEETETPNGIRGENNKYWDGGRKKHVEKTKQDVMDCVAGMELYMTRAGKVDGGIVKEMYIAIGAGMHAIQDYSAHSFVVDSKYYRKHYKDFEKGSPVAVYHNDYEEDDKKQDKKNESEYIFKGNNHSRYKDNENQDFIDGEWKKSSFNKNSRIIKSIEESADFLLNVISQ